MFRLLATAGVVMQRLIHIPSARWCLKRELRYCKACNKDLANEEYILSTRNNKKTRHYCISCAKRYLIL
ncbi:MAG: hypothetical protein QXE38_05565 [Candidatus Methanomethylicia archaeon]